MSTEEKKRTVPEEPLSDTENVKEVNQEEVPASEGVGEPALSDAASETKAEKTKAVKAKAGTGFSAAEKKATAKKTAKKESTASEAETASAESAETVLAEEPSAEPAESEDAKPVEADNANPAEGEDVKPAESDNAKPAEGEDTKPIEGDNAKPAEGEGTKPIESDNARPAEGGNAEPEKTPKPENKAAASGRKHTEPDDDDEHEHDSGEKVDFDDEEAALAASDIDMGDDIDDENDEHSGEDTAGSLESISGMNKHELVDMFATLLEHKPVQQLRREAEAVKVAFYKIHRAEYETLRKQFMENGGNEEDFQPSADMEELRLKELFAEYRRRRAEYLSNLEKAKEDNLNIKFRIIEELKELINGSETLNNTFNTFRDLQQRWRETGVVPQANVKELWETYNLHVENFYNYIKINKELRDLDLRRNYEAKVQLCEAAEALVMEPSIVAAFRKLQELHDQWREIGPVANEYKETLWERFKEASSRVNKQHQEHFEGLKEEQRRNLELKAELCVKAEELSGEILTTRKEWNKASDRLIEIQKVWKTIGFAPQKDNTRIYERFRRACDRFFEQKRAFYEQIKSEMDHNLQMKTEICVMAEALRDSDQWKKTTDELIALQKQWKEIGPVSRRHSDAIWKRFRAACDHFFERKSAHFSGVDAQHEENLQKKQDLLKEMEAADISEGGFEMIKEFQRRWNEIGFVPIKQKDAVQKQYKAVVDAMFNQLRGGEHERSMDRFRSKVSSMKGGGDRRLKFEREKLYGRVRQLESDIALLENNIGFFSRSKNAEAMIKDVQDKIEKAKREMAESIEKINLIDSQE